MKRREFIAGLGAAGLRAPLAFAEGNIKTVGILLGGNSNDSIWQSYLAAFMEQLRSFGWVESRTVRFEQRWASGDPAVMRNTQIPCEVTDQ